MGWCGAGPSGSEASAGLILEEGWAQLLRVGASVGAEVSARGGASRGQSLVEQRG